MLNFFNGISIKSRILLNSGLLLCLIAFCSFYALQSMQRIGGELEGIAKFDMPLTESIMALTEHELQQEVHLERAIRYGMLLDREKGAQQHFMAEIDAFNALNSKVDKEILADEAFVDKAISEMHDIEAVAEFTKIGSMVKQIEKGHHLFAEHSRQIFALLKAGKPHEAELKAELLQTEEEKLEQALEAVLFKIEHFTEEAIHRAEEHEHEAFTTMLIVSIGAFVLGIFLSWSLANSIAARLKMVDHDLAAIATGDLTKTIDYSGRDEIASLQNSALEMQNQLKDMLSQINSTTDEVSSSAEEMSAVMTQTLSNAMQQQQEASQVANAMNNMNKSSEEVADNIVETVNTANSANQETVAGHKVVAATVHEINTLSEQINQVSEAILKVQNDSHEINSVLVVIKGIAEQTNLLALNAAIEAARAGEQGRGFAVVADEVRTLAAKTQESTEEINQTIENLQNGSQQAVDVMQQSKKQVEAVVNAANQAGDSLTTISASVDSINNMSHHISGLAEQQKNICSDIHERILKIQDMTEETSQGAKATATASEMLASNSHKLQDLVNRFRVA